MRPRFGEPAGDAIYRDAAAPGKMTPQEARRLLDAQKDGERPMIFLPRQTNATPPRILKDW